MRNYFIVSLLLILITDSICAEEKKSEKNTVINDLTIGKIETLLSERKQGLTIINLWATWCPPCVAELPHFGNIYKQYSDKDVRLYLINIEGKQAKDSVLKPFLQKNPLPCHVYLLEDGGPEELEKVLKTELSGALPITIIYNSDGKIVKKFEDSITENDIKSVLEAHHILPTSQK